MLCDAVAEERSDGVRIVTGNREFLAFVPHVPAHGLEVHVLAHRHAASVLDLSDPEREALGAVLRTVVGAYARLGYSWKLEVHQAPTDDGGCQHISHLHVEIVPEIVSAIAPASADPSDGPEGVARALRAASR